MVENNEIQFLNKNHSESSELPEDSDINYNEIKKNYSEIIHLLSQIKNAVTKEQKKPLLNFQKIRNGEDHF